MAMRTDLHSKLADTLMLGPLLEMVSQEWGSFEFEDHWQQGEFHHDVVLKLPHDQWTGSFLVVSTNCNGGVKEVISFTSKPDRYALWHFRCPDNPEFSGNIPNIKGKARTAHWYDPCQLLEPDARSEYLPSQRTRQRGGGWVKKTRDS